MANCEFCKLQYNCPGLNECVHWSEDAQRYNWLRAQHASEGRSVHVRTACNDVMPEDLDAAIDAEMKTHNLRIDT